MEQNEKEYISNDFLEFFDKFAIAEGISEKTKKEYLYRVNYMVQHLKKDFLDITEADADAYFHTLQVSFYNHDISKRTIYNRYSLYKNLGSYIERQFPEYGYVNAFESIVVNIPDNSQVDITKIPTTAEIDLMLSNAPNQMVYLIIALVYRVGLTSSEIHSLKLPQVVDIEGNTFIVMGRGTVKERFVALPEDIKVLLKEYITSLSYMDEEKHLFYNKYNNPLTAVNTCSILSSLTQKCGFGDKKYTFKDIRERAILDMVKASVDAKRPVSAVGEYVGIKTQRLDAYSGAAKYIKNNPAELVNISVKAYVEKPEGSDADE